MNSKTKNIVKRLFKEYYSKNLNKIFIPKSFANREFAFQPFTKQGMIRHLGFDKPEDLYNFLLENIPRHSYYSTAIYVLPSARDMDEKGWLGAELVFDIDADHINTPCKLEHDSWKCLNCGYQGKGPAPDKCPKCGSKNIKGFTWVCEKCIEAARNEIIKLIEGFLIPDLGFKPSDMLIAFSGHRGFHLHVLCDECLKLSSSERREIVDYVKGLGLSLETILPPYKRRGEVAGIDLGEKGWRGKIAKKLFEKVSSLDESLEEIVGRRAFRKLLENSDKIIKEMTAETPKWTLLYRSLGSKGLLLLLTQKIIDEIKCSVDEKVTIDTHRLIRLPGSLHGKTGLPVMVLRGISDLERFELSDRLSPFKGEATIRLIEDLSRSLTIFSVAVGGKAGTKYKVSLPVALYLACRELAEIEEVER